MFNNRSYLLIYKGAPFAVLAIDFTVPAEMFESAKLLEGTK
jgi:hypothetical protein